MSILKIKLKLQNFLLLRKLRIISINTDFDVVVVINAVVVLVPFVGSNTSIFIISNFQGAKISHYET